MINTGLDKKYNAEEYVPVDFSPIPKGDYECVVKDIKPWKEEIKTIKVYLKGPDGKNLIDDKGEKMTETVKDCKFYNSNIRLEVAEGEFKGRLLFYNLTTHPNMGFTIPSFLYGVELDGIAASEIPTKAKGRRVLVSVDVTTYPKKVVDKDTGIENTVQEPKNEVKSFKPSQYAQDIEVNEEDLGL